MRYDHLFFACFLFFLLVHVVFWHAVNFIDQDPWVVRVQQLAHDLRNPSVAFNTVNYGAHPGMAVVLIAAVAHILGSTPATGLKGAVALLAALAIAGIAVACKAARPRTGWWLMASAFVGFNPLNLHITPTNAVMALLVPLMSILVLLLYEARGASRRWVLCTVLGLCAGLALATRMIETIVLGSFFVLFLLPTLRIKKIFLVIGTAIITAVAFDPLLWFIPFEHVRHVVSRATAHFSDVGVGSVLVTDPVLFREALVLSASLAVISAVLGYFFVLLHQLYVPPVPWKFLFLLLFLTLAFAALFLTATSRSPRYFYPLIFLWQMLLPILWSGVNDVRRRVPLLFFQRHDNLITRAWHVIFLLLVGSHVSLTLYIFAVIAR